MSMITSPKDSIGKIERRGVDFIPHDERHSGPKNIFWILIGSNLCVALFVVGWLPVSFGLGWWASFWSIIVGAAIGASILAPVALLGPRTGTNGAVSSGAFFGVVGRVVGSLIALLVNLGFYALSVWTGGEVVVLGLHRIMDVSNNNVSLGISYAAIAALSSVVAIYGHASMLLVERLMIPTFGLLILVGFIVYEPSFSPTYAGGQYLLGAFWPTWGLAVTTAAVAVYLYVNSVCDWTRYISLERYSEASIVTATWTGSVLGVSFPLIFGAYVAVAISNTKLDFITGMVQLSPMFYLVPLVLIGSVGSLGQCTLLLYSTGLDFSSLFPIFRRPVATIILSIISVVFVFVGTMIWNIQNSLTVFIQLLGISSAAWLAVIVIGHFYRKGYYDVHALQVFNRREKGGAYWHWYGWNLRAVIPFICGNIVGCLFLNCSLYVGPWSNAASGVDLSWVSAMLMTGLSYYACVRLFPEGDNAFGQCDPHLADLVSIDREETEELA